MLDSFTHFSFMMNTTQIRPRDMYQLYSTMYELLIYMCESVSVIKFATNLGQLTVVEKLLHMFLKEVNIHI